MTRWCTTLQKAQSFLYVRPHAQMFRLIPDGVNHSLKKDIMSGTEKTNNQDISAVFLRILLNTAFQLDTPTFLYFI